MDIAIVNSEFGCRVGYCVLKGVAMDFSKKKKR